jgi:hypothetical protein
LLTDPQATWVARPGLDPFFAYDANYLLDNKAGIIIDAVGTRANRAVEIAVTFVSGFHFGVVRLHGVPRTTG